MERVDPPKGHVLTTQDEVHEILAVEAELLRSEGIRRSRAREAPRPSGGAGGL